MVLPAVTIQDEYPSNEKLYITVDGYTGSYAVAAPADGVLVSDINFPAATTAAPVYNNDMAVFKTYDEGYSGTATALTFSVTPYDGITSLSVKDDKENSVVYDDLPSITGTSQIVFGVIYPDIVGADIFNVNVQ